MCPTRNKIPKRHIFVLTFSLHITFERVTDGTESASMSVPHRNGRSVRFKRKDCQTMKKEPKNIGVFGSAFAVREHNARAVRRHNLYYVFELYR